MITSKENAWFKRVREAIREHGDEILIEGPKAVEDAIAAGWKPIAVFVNDVEPALSRLEPAKSRFYVLARELFKSISDTKTSQGVIALFERPRWKADVVFSRSDSVIVALDGVQDPGNVGTIVRLAAAFDAAGVVLLPGCADAYGPKAIRASAGAILTVPVVEMPVEALLACGRTIVYADAAGDATAPPPQSVIVFGSEGGGVSPAIRAATRPIAVATSGRVESLNVAASAAILLWQVWRNLSS